MSGGFFCYIMNLTFYSFFTSFCLSESKNNRTFAPYNTYSNRLYRINKKERVLVCHWKSGRTDDFYIIGTRGSLSCQYDGDPEILSRLKQEKYNM